MKRFDWSRWFMKWKNDNKLDTVMEQFKWQAKQLELNFESGRNH